MRNGKEEVAREGRADFLHFESAGVGGDRHTHSRRERCTSEYAFNTTREPRKGKSNNNTNKELMRDSHASSRDRSSIHAEEKAEMNGFEVGGEQMTE